MASALPDWLLAKDLYVPRNDKDSFIDRSISSFLRVLSRIRLRGSTGTTRIHFNAAALLVSILLFILLLSLSRSVFFVAVSGTLFLALLAVLPASLIFRVLKVSVPAAAFTFVIMLPSALWGNVQGTAMVSTKVFLAVGAVKLYSTATEWVAISRALRVLLLPNLFVLVLDITIRYIGLLGELALAMLYALKLRSVGRNEGKAASLSGIAGTLFLKSRDMAEGVYAAMECRCFTGDYRTGRFPRLGPVDAIPFAVDGALFALFLMVRAG